MTETNDRITSPRRHRLLPWIATGAVALAVAIAGCGGGHSAGASNPAPSGSMQSGGQASQSIPQHNGGDQDSDNNGGPSDGDGNL